MTEVEDFIGCLLSVDCASDDVFQGRVIAVSPQDQSLTLEHPFRNGIPCHLPQITLQADEIMNLTVLKSPNDFQQPVLVKAPRRRQQRRNSSSTPQKQFTVAAAFQRRTRQNTDSSTDSSTTADFRVPGSKLQIAQKRDTKFICCASYSEYYESQNGRQGKTKQVLAEERNAHLYAPIDKQQMAKDFDFEANLALFDKESFCGRISRSERNGKDGGSNVRGKKQKHFRHDENIVDDESRVESWVKKTPSLASLSSSVADTSGGTLVPKDSYFKQQEAAEENEFLTSKFPGLNLNNNGGKNIVFSYLHGARSSNSNSSDDWPPCLTSEERRMILSEALQEVPMDFLAGNFASRIVECLTESENNRKNGAKEQYSSCSLVNEIL